MLPALLDADGLLYTVAGFLQVLHITQVLIVKKHNIRFRALEILNESFLAQLHVQGNGHAAGGGNAHQDGQIFIAALSDQGDMGLFPQFSHLVDSPVCDSTGIHRESPVTLFIYDPVCLITDKNLVFKINRRVFQQVTQCVNVFPCDHGYRLPPLHAF